MSLGAWQLAAAGAAAIGAGAINAIAGGGTLISFPTLVAVGVPAVPANVTNTVALCPGYLGGALALRPELEGQSGRVRALALTAGIGGLAGSIALVVTSEAVFRQVVPFLILVSCVLLAAGEGIKRRLPSLAARSGSRPGLGLHAGVLLAAAYGGYFGAGLGILLLAVLGLFVHESLHRVNALKTLMSLVTNLVAAVFFLFSAKVVWSAAAVMAPASLLGGAVGGRLSRRVNPRLLRAIVLVFGVAVAVRFWL